MKFLIALSIIFVVSSAFADTCADELKRNIDFAYNDGGLSVTNVVGPINWNEGVQNSDGSYGLASMVAYAVSYDVDTEVLNGKAGTVLISAECEHAEPAFLEDKRLCDEKYPRLVRQLRQRSPKSHKPKNSQGLCTHHYV